jgi:hypothetical protein
MRFARPQFDSARAGGDLDLDAAQPQQRRGRHREQSDEWQPRR